jgi:hypothetical protein
LNARRKLLSIREETLLQACDEDLRRPGRADSYVSFVVVVSKQKDQRKGLMKNRILMGIAVLAAALSGGLPAQGKELKELRVLYVGAERPEQFLPFLQHHVANVESRKRTGFVPADAVGFDVVLLDWPQGEETREMRKLKSPLGRREEWNKPTVLLGSAGLNLAVSWKLKGGSGCTCMSPLAYDLRAHEIFDKPFLIERSKSVQIPTPPDFQQEIKAAKIEVLPLVSDYRKEGRYPGWCSYSYDFSSNPDVEFFCGGVNHKTPTAAGCWRQGNLLHFGFQESPAEMNESGQHLLLNAIAYISRFTEDRPIAITPSVFAGPVARPRASLLRYLRNTEYQFEWVKENVTPSLWAKFESLGREKAADWVEQNGKFLHPDANQQLETDKDLEALGMAFDQKGFLVKAIAELRGGGPAAERADRLLHRYVPCGPAQGNPEQWTAWLNENELYLFASDSGDYRWYVDPLAKKRGVPSVGLRGPKRADSPATVAAR